MRLSDIALAITAVYPQAGGAPPPPPPASTDPRFKDVILLLHGDGVNGSQNNTFLDSSSNALTVTRNGSVTQGSFSPFNQSGWANYFDGVSTLDYISFPSSTAFDFGAGNFTIEGWILTLTSTIGGVICRRGPGGGNTGTFEVWCTGSTLQFFGNNNANVSTNSTIINDGNWHHFAVVRNGNDTILYVDGVAGTVNSTLYTYPAGDQPIFIASDPESHATRDLDAYLSNIRIVKGTAVYTSNFTPPTAPLTAIPGTSLLTCQSNRFRDASSNNFPVTITGQPRVEALSPFAPTIPYGVSTVGGSAYFDGVGDYLSAPNSPGFSFPGDFTIELWYYPTAANGSYDVLLKCSDNGGWTNGWTLHLSGTANSQDISFFGATQSLNQPAKLYQWNHIVVARSGTTLALFCNGDRVGVTTNPTSYAPTNVLTVGGDASGAYYAKGYITNVRVVKGSAVYDPTSTTLTIPTAPPTNITNTQFLFLGTNGGIFDNSGRNTLDIVGNAQISTTRAKWGNGSIYFDGNSDWISVVYPVEYKPRLREFTIEFWVNLASYTGDMVLFDTRPQAVDTMHITLYVAAGTNKVIFYSMTTAQITSTVSLALNQWYHIALSKVGTESRLFIDGVLQGTRFGDTILYQVGVNRPLLGTSGTNVGFANLSGYIDDVRVTIGPGRYTANFTPPTAAFPDQ